jgi:hypothetical protein
MQDSFYARLKDYKFRIQSDFLISNLNHIVVLDWFMDEETHKYLALTLDEVAYIKVKDNLGAYVADRFVECASLPTPKTRIGRWIIEFARKHL